MSAASKSGGDGGASEMELVECEKSISLESEQGKDQGGGKTETVAPEMSTMEESAADVTCLRMMEELAAAIQNLTSKEDPTPEDKATATKLISEMEVLRVQLADKERLARKAAWIEKSRAEVRQRVEFRNGGTSDLFPELVWKQILEGLEDPKDKAQVSRMNSLWRNELKNDRATFLFHEVFPLLHPHLSKADILNFRGVSKEWKSSLETYLQNKLDYSDDVVGPVPNFTDDLETKFHAYHSQVRNYLERTLQAYGTGSSNSNRNPFISRKVHLGFMMPIVDVDYEEEEDDDDGEEDDDDDDGEEEDEDAGMNVFLRSQLPWFYWHAVTLLLGDWGKQVWHVQIKLDLTTNKNSICVYQRLHALLSLMPNLRYLAVDYKDDRMDPDAPPKFCHVLERTIKELPFPALAHLGTLVTRDVPPQVIEEILKGASTTLETFSLIEWFGTPNGCAENIRLPSLKHFFHLCKYSDLSGLKFAVDWPILEELSLCYLNMEALEIPILFQYLKDFGGTLRKLDLVVQKVDGSIAKLEDYALRKLSLELPLLEEFSLYVSRVNLKTVDFILPMTRLKKLTVTYEKFASSAKKTKKKQAGGSSKSMPMSNQNFVLGSEEIIKFGNYTTRLYDSNIWNLFPELKSVTIKTVTTSPGVGEEDEDVKETKQRSYTREGYKQHCKGGGNGCPTS